MKLCPVLLKGSVHACCFYLPSTHSFAHSVLRLHVTVHAWLWQVREYLFAQTELNLTGSDDATVASNVIYLIELLPPPKAEAVAYLDGNGTYPAPPSQVLSCHSAACSLCW